ncbi:MAG: hypothetical protein AAFR13_06355 [Pseudomonadota bacterium]
MKRLALGVFLCGFSAVAAAAEERLPLFHGQWALDGKQCGQSYNDGVAENQFIEIGRGTFRMYEAFCKITQVIQVTDQEWRTELVCSSEGESTTNEWAIDKISSTEFIVGAGAGEGNTYKLCPK